MLFCRECAYKLLEIIELADGEVGVVAAGEEHVDKKSDPGKLGQLLNVPIPTVAGINRRGHLDFRRRSQEHPAPRSLGVVESFERRISIYEIVLSKQRCRGSMKLSSGCGGLSCGFGRRLRSASTAEGS